MVPHRNGPAETQNLNDSTETEAVFKTANVRFNC